MQCGVCLFHGGSQQPPLTAAFVVAFGPKTPCEVLQRATARAALAVVPKSSAYCTACRRVTWLACSTDLIDALVRHEYDHQIAVQVLKVQRMQVTI